MGGGGRSEWIRGSREVCRQEVAERTAMLVEQSLANKQHPHKAEKCAAVLARERHCHEVVERAAMLVARALANERCCHEAAGHPVALAELALAREQHSQKQQWQQ
jgi:hypothetical protein